MKKPLSIDPSVLTRLAALSKDRRAECLLAVVQMAEAYGQPHLHSGVSIRKLRPRLFEFRGNLDMRFLFLDRGTDLRLCFMGNHDEVQRALKSGKYD